MDSSSIPLSDEILLEHAAWVRKVARELVRDPGTADDLAQETWLAFFRARPDPNRPLRPWFRTTLRNALSLRARRRSAQTWREAEVAQPEAVPSSADILVKAEEQHRLARLVLDLDEPYRTTLLLRYSEGLSPAQIAEARGIPSSTVRSHLHRGLQALRERLDEDHGGDRRAWIAVLQPLALPAKAVHSVSAATFALTALTAMLAIWAGFAWAHRDGGAASTGDVERLAAAGGGAVETPATLAAADPSRTAVSDEAERVLTLVDGRTGRPLVSYAVRIDGRTLVADADGRLRVPAGTARLVPLDDPGLATRVPISHARTAERPIARGPVQIPDDGIVALSAGPAYVLDVETQVVVDMSELRITLVGQGRVEPTAPLQVASLRAANPGFDGHWVRFAAVPVGAERAGVTWRLEARDLAGHVAGHASVLSVVPADVPTVQLELVATGAIVGTIAGLSPAAATEATVVLRSDAPDSRVAASTMPNRDGRFALRWLEPGAYTLQVVSAEHEDWAADVEIHAGETHAANVTVDVAADAGPVEGIVRSETGEYAGQLLVFLLDAGGRTIGVDATTWQTSDGEHALEAPFRFEGIAPGPVTLDVVSLEDLVTCRMVPDSFEVPCEGIEVTLRDRRPASNWIIDVEDQSTAAPIERFEVEIRIDDGAPRRFLRAPGERATPLWTLIAGDLRWNTFQGPTALRALPTDARISWSVHAEGYTSVAGDETDFEPRPSGERTAIISLQAADAR